MGRNGRDGKRDGWIRYDGTGRDATGWDGVRMGVRMVVRMGWDGVRMGVRMVVRMG